MTAVLARNNRLERMRHLDNPSDPLSPHTADGVDQPGGDASSVDVVKRTLKHAVAPHQVYAHRILTKGDDAPASNLTTCGLMTKFVTEENDNG